MKKFISMLLVTAFMLAAFSAFGVPTQAVNDTFTVTGPYYEANVTFDVEYECNFTVEQGGMYIIQTFGFLGIDAESSSVGNGGMVSSMTLKDNTGTVLAMDTWHSGYGENAFMYVALSTAIQYTLEIEGGDEIGRISFTNTTGLFADVLTPEYYYDIYEFAFFVTNPPTFTFDYFNEHEAQVARITGDGRRYQVSVMGSGCDKVLIIDPRVELHYDGMDTYAGIYDVDDLGQTPIQLEDDVPYYLVVFFERGYDSMLQHLGVESIDVVVRFRVVG